MSLPEVLNAHHDKLNEHTAEIKTLQARIDALEAEVAGLKPVLEAYTKLNDWLGQIKEIAT